MDGWLTGGWAEESLVGRCTKAIVQSYDGLIRPGVVSSTGIVSTEEV